MGNSIANSNVKQKNDVNKTNKQTKSDKLFDKETYTYTYNHIVYDKNGVIIEDRTKEYLINTNDFLERLKTVTHDFIKEYCHVGQCEITENLLILTCAYHEYLYTYLDEGSDRIYGSFFMNQHFSERQKLMFLLQSIEDVTLIIDDNIFGTNSIRIKNDVNNYKEVFNCSVRLANPRWKLTGVAGIKLAKYPM